MITSADAKSWVLIAPDYEVDQGGMLLYCPRSAIKSEDSAELVRLVILELLRGSKRSFTGEVCIEVYNVL